MERAAGSKRGISRGDATRDHLEVAASGVAGEDRLGMESPASDSRGAAEVCKCGEGGGRHIPRKGRGTGVFLAGLKACRHQVGYTVRELASLSGVAASTITRLEREKGGADPHTILRLAAALELEAAALISGVRSAS